MGTPSEPFDLADPSVSRIVPGNPVSRFGDPRQISADCVGLKELPDRCSIIYDHIGEISGISNRGRRQFHNDQEKDTEYSTSLFSGPICSEKKEALFDFKDLIEHGRTITTVSEIGNPTRAVRDFAKNEDPDQIVPGAPVVGRRIMAPSVAPPRLSSGQPSILPQSFHSPGFWVAIRFPW